MLLKRAHYVDYLPPFDKYLAGLFIPMVDGSAENLDLTTFIAPFSIDIWVMIIVSSITIGFIKLIFKYNHGSIEITDFFGFIWRSFIANFGGKPANTSLDLKPSYRLTVFVSLLSGAVIWITYRSSLTAELSDVSKKYPFYDIKGLLKSDWRYVLIIVGSNPSSWVQRLEFLKGLHGWVCSLRFGLGKV